MNRVTVLIIAVMSAFLVSTVGFSSMAMAETQEITLPVWEEGDTWSMGFFQEFDEDTLMNGNSESSDDGEYYYNNDDFYYDDYDDFSDDSEILSAITELGTFNVDGSVGFFQTMTVIDTDDTSTGIECYKVKVEQYYGAITNINIDLHADETDIFGLSAPENFNFEIDATVKGYLWFEMDATGFIYFTVDALAIAREEINIDTNLDVDIYAYLNMVTDDIPGGVEEGGEGSSSTSEDEIIYDDSYEDDYLGGDDFFPEEMEMDISIEATDISIDYDIDYEPPLDIFDFPIVPEEEWQASSDMTVTLNELSGTITYDISGNIPEEDITSESDTIKLGEGLVLPDTYGPVSVSYLFESVGTAIVGEYDDCMMIESYQDYGYDDYYYRRGEYPADSVSASKEAETDDSPMDMLDDFEAFDAEAASDFNPFNMHILSKSYYSPTAGNVVQADLSETEDIPLGDMSDGPLGLMGDTGGVSAMKMEPVSKNDVENFKNTQRKSQEDKYNDYKAGNSGDSGIGSTMLLALIGIIIVIVLLVIAAMMMKKKKQELPPPGYEHTPPQGYGYSTEVAPPAETIRPGSPPPLPPEGGSVPPPPPPPPGY